MSGYVVDRVEESELVEWLKVIPDDRYGCCLCNTSLKPFPIKPK